MASRALLSAIDYWPYPMTHRPTIGLEVHAELTTRTKMFCDCANDPDETRPNVNVCPICMAHPGTLPVINREAVFHILRIGSAVGGTLADFSEFDRKSYFYPDIPKGYQISQYEYPFITGGSLAGVTLTRIHLEEDTARSVHAKGKSFRIEVRLQIRISRSRTSRYESGSEESELVSFCRTCHCVRDKPSDYAYNGWRERGTRNARMG